MMAKNTKSRSWLEGKWNPVWLPQTSRDSTSASDLTWAKFLRRGAIVLFFAVFIAVVVDSAVRALGAEGSHAVPTKSAIATEDSKQSNQRDGVSPTTVGQDQADAAISSSLDAAQKRRVLFGALIAVGHVTYVYLAAGGLVLWPPLLRVRKQDATLPALLALGYVTNVVGSFFHLPPVKIAALFVFGAMYALWFLRDWLEFREPGLRGKALKKLWLWIDALSCIAMLSFAVGGIAGATDPYWYPGKSPSGTATAAVPILTPKDIVLLVSLTYYVGTLTVLRRGVTDEYADRYRAYLEHVDETAFLTSPNPELRKALQSGLGAKLTLTGQAVAVTTGETLRVFDYGCANGWRAHQVFGLLGLLPMPTSMNGTAVALPTNVKLHGYDTHDGWTDDFLRRFTLTQDGFSSHNGHDPAEWDLVVLSHVVYNQGPSFDELCRFLSGARSGTVVFVRGTGPYCVFNILSRHGETNPFAPTEGHLWFRVLLPELVRECNLESLLPTHAGVEYGHITVPQAYRLDAASIHALANFVQVIYNDRVADIARDICMHLKQVGQVTEIPNTDIAFVFRKK